jgi:hypothetical protein
LKERVSHPNGVQVVLVNNRDLGRVARSRLDGVLVKLPVIPNHIELLLHGDVAEGLFNLIVGSEEDYPLLGGKEGELVLASLVERGEVETSHPDTDVRRELLLISMVSPALGENQLRRVTK